MISFRMGRILSVVCFLSAILGVASLSAQDVVREGRFAKDNIVIGLEYQTLDNERLVVNTSKVLAETGMTGMKHFVEAVQWGNMQKRPKARIDFKKLDWFVKEYQKNGFTELTISLKSHSAWASIDMKGIFNKTWGSNPTPKPEYMPLYKKWVSAVVERYDADGIDDMPGLRWPVRYIEIGNEFSSFEPEPVEDYLKILEAAYEAAHSAYEDVKVAHCAFLLTPVNMDVDDPADYETRWETTYRRDTHHDLRDMRIVLDNPQWFDVLNFHNLGDPYEIEDIVKWLTYETSQRGYSREMIISDTTPTSYIGWGPAVTCKGPKERLGVIARPATEDDRCHLARYFTKLSEGDAATLEWTRGFVAADHVQRAIIAAEQDIELINLAFVGDIPVVSSKIGKAGAGISAWAGTLKVNIWRGEIQERYAPFYAIRQMMGHLNGYSEIKRIEMQDLATRVYEITMNDRLFWVAWQNPMAPITSLDPVSTTMTNLNVGVDRIRVEAVITNPGQTEAESMVQETVNGVAQLELSHTPVYIFPEK